MILLLGATGYIGQAFANELRWRGCSYIPLSRKAIDYTCFETLFDYVRKMHPSFLINAAGHTGRPNVDACEIARTETIQGNTLFPQTVARVCSLTNTPWAHVSSGCIYSGAKVGFNGSTRIERDLSQPRLQRLFAEHPEHFSGFMESDEPNFSFRNPPCSFYSGTKALAEESLSSYPNLYIWRLRIPFNEVDDARNYLSKVQRYLKVYNNINSLSHLGDFVRACLDVVEINAPYGTYNVVNAGAVSTRQVVEKIVKILKPQRQLEFWKNDEEFYRFAARTPRSNCILDSSKLLRAGVRMRPVEEAIEDSLERWQPCPHLLQAMENPDEKLVEVDFRAAEQTSASLR
jgi:UDP-glucose 4,6-dehydratase